MVLEDNVVGRSIERCELMRQAGVSTIHCPGRGATVMVSH